MSLSDARSLVPEAILLAGALLVAGLGAARPRTSLRTHIGLTLLALAAAAVAALAYLRGMPADGTVAYSAGLVVDRAAIFAAVVLCGFGAVSALSSDLLRGRIADHSGEYCALLLAATLGAVLLSAAREMISLYVALELLSISLYVLVAIVKTDERGSEAGFKYLVMGAASSAVLLYGLAILYGLSGSTVLTEVGPRLHGTPGVAALAIVLVLAGLAFKLGSVPFQQWVPDVYEGAPAPVAGLIASLSKTAGFVVVARLAVTTFPLSASTWTAVIAVLSASSMLLGNLAALAQRSLRRLLGWAAVGQAGFALMGVLAWRTGGHGIAATFFYLATYGLTIIGCFAAVSVAEAHGVGAAIDDYRGLSRRAPLAAAMLGLAMVSLVGVPPLVGFFAKLFVFEAAVTAGYAWLLLIALVMTVVSAGYYLRVLRVLVVDAPASDPPSPVATGGPLRIVLGSCALATVGLSVLAQPILALATAGGDQIR